MGIFERTNAAVMLLESLMYSRSSDNRESDQYANIVFFADLRFYVPITLHKTKLQISCSKDAEETRILLSGREHSALLTTRPPGNCAFT